MNNNILAVSLGCWEDQGRSWTHAHALETIRENANHGLPFKIIIVRHIIASTPLGPRLELKLDEEEERRKRRREKNKVAAARCRNKKKERTEFLQRESERLELMNAELKTQIEELKQERQQLILMLNRHRPTCIVRTDSVKTPESEGNPLLEQLEKK
ncbi:jun dimerization protein 2 isoform X2 [Mirounga angustirostris]|uniref:jun dimerization protein 2 isoform X1 n=1 Tax=Mirounga leonina TaxID=9715 RepID=UPI00156C0D94|nr:jun dimerization protein 2 isoform X1 [Mirounga leonina]XP_045757219.1 jun dimerization protein 2 isoform X1 [Mirounga angustirostris]